MLPKSLADRELGADCRIFSVTSPRMWLLFCLRNKFRRIGVGIMVELQFSFNEDDIQDADLFLKTVDDFVLWLSDQDEMDLPFEKDLGIMVRTKYAHEGQIYREIAFESRSGAAFFLKFWRRVRHDHVSQKNDVFGTGKIGMDL